MTARLLGSLAGLQTYIDASTTRQPWGTVWLFFSSIITSVRFVYFRHKEPLISINKDQTTQW